MRRCIELAQSGAGNTAPNPLVGAVLVHEGRIIGEGFHEEYGKAHAEVNCLNNVASEDSKVISRSVLYVSLEPCSHFGKTPPCTDLIIENKIPHVVIGCRDTFEKVNGSGMEKLRSAGVITEAGILERECRKINKRFFTFHEKERPYIILKWAQSKDAKIAGGAGTPIKISNDFTNLLVHKWRAEETSILVGTNTVLNDDPSLTTRKWPGKNPVRIIIDSDLKINAGAKIFDDTVPTVIINRKKNETVGFIEFFRLNENETVTVGAMRCLFENQLNSVIIEGGAETLQHFIEAGLWDEARVITNDSLLIRNGINSPVLKDEILIRTENISSDRIDFFKKDGNEFL